MTIEEYLNTLSTGGTVELKEETLTKICVQLKEWEELAKNYSEKIKNLEELVAEYQTKEQAEWARDKMRSFNRQLAWVAENDDGWREDWNDIKQQKWFIYYDHRKKSYGASYETENKDVNKIYMSDYNANILAEALNFGEVVL